ncbi:MAG: peptidylprolyl isomerase [Verrucomicrobia bacterium]|nr:peptidylprolyl isomerase [Verrucomicrobiota bacterium]
MIRVRRSFLFLVVTFLATYSLRGQSTTPAATQALPAQTFAIGAGAVQIDLKNYFTLPNVTGQVAQIDTVRGKFNVELLANDAPLTVANFLKYANRGAYANALFHRSVPGFVIQGGGFALVGNQITAIAADAPVNNEFKIPNTRGTLAMAKTAAGPNTATNQWFVNLADNRSNLDNQNGGFTVFARVLGTGMTVPDNIASLPVFDASTALNDATFNQLPLTTNTLNAQTLILINSVKVIPVYPAAAGDTAVLTFSVINPSPTIVTATVSASTLTLTPGTGGNATLTVRATDVNGNFAESTLAITNNGSVPAPSFITQPVAQTVASGSTVVFNASALNLPTYQWRRNGVEVEGATAANLVIPAATAAHAGTYTVVATNGTGSVTSNAAALAVSAATPTEIGRLVNLSIRTGAGAGAKILTVGASVGPLSSTESLPLIMRGVGPRLAAFGISDALADPTMTIFRSGSDTSIASNDNWGSGDATALAAAFLSVGAFDLTAGSLDSAYATPAPGFGVGGYTVQIAGKGTTTGTVLAEIYDAAGSTRTATTPRLVNLSTRAQIDANGELLVGFVLRGVPTKPLARTVLIRAVGPSLAALGVDGTMADPKLELFDNDHGSAKLGENDNWGGDAQTATVASAVGAFALSGPATKDAVLLVTLPPGAYSARLSGVGGGGGTAIIEVYEVP